MKSILTQQFSGSSFVSPALGGAGQGRLNINNNFPPKKIWAKPKRAGKKEGGLGEGIFARPFPKRSPAALLVQSRVQQKSFLFLLEEKEIARQIKKCEENFFAKQRAKRAAAGRSGQISESRFCSKKVRISSNKHQILENHKSKGIVSVSQKLTYSK